MFGRESQLGPPIGLAATLFFASTIISWAIGQEQPETQTVVAKYELIEIRGRVVELGPYLKRTLNVPMDADAGKATLVLVTDSGEVHPLIKDGRSRGFWLDERLRDRPMELHLHRFPGLPYVRLIDAFSFIDGKKHHVEYWCDICAITTYERGPCPCCQDEIELRERPVDDPPSDRLSGFLAR